MQSSTIPTPTRHLQLEGTYNVRDTGGYATADGRVTRWRTLLRGDSLHRLTPEGQAELIDAGLRTVIDLRRESERESAVNVFAASDRVRYLNISLLDGTADVTPDGPRTLDAIYAGILAGAQAQLRILFAALAEPDALPVLIHCAAGKDRTGVVVALLLGNAGVPTATIAADYALSESYLGDGFVAEVRERIVASGGDWESYAPLMGSPEDLMLQTLAAVETRYGGVPHYLRAIGVPEETLAILRATLTTESVEASETPRAATTFIHLTDTHIQPTENDSFFGLDTLERLHETLALLRARGVLPGTPVVISGDLANNGEPESYSRLRAVLDALRNEGTTVFLALGNHDNRAVFRSAMLDETASDGSAKYQYTAMLGGVRLIVLDSHELGTHDGALGAVQLAWLRDELATPAPEGTVLVVHHPPTEAPAPALAGHLLKDAEALRAVIAGTDVVGVLAGHTHMAAMELFGGVPSVTAPGTAFLLDVAAPEGMRFLDGGGINLVTVCEGVMTVAPLTLPRSQHELYHHRPGDPIERLMKAIATPSSPTLVTA